MILAPSLAYTVKFAMASPPSAAHYPIPSSFFVQVVGKESLCDPVPLPMSYHTRVSMQIGSLSYVPTLPGQP